MRAEIARSTEPSGTVARRYGISAETVCKWRKRGAADCLDRSARPHRLLTFVVTHFLPHLNRDSIWRILRAKGLNRRRPVVSAKPARGQGTFKDYDLGFSAFPLAESA